MSTPNKYYIGIYKWFKVKFKRSPTEVEFFAIIARAKNKKK